MRSILEVVLNSYKKIRYRRYAMAKSKGKRKRRNDSLVLQLMILVAVVLVVFEGKLVITMVTHRASTSGTQSAG